MRWRLYGNIPSRSTFNIVNIPIPLNIEKIVHEYQVIETPLSCYYLYVYHSYAFQQTRCSETFWNADQSTLVITRSAWLHFTETICASARVTYTHKWYTRCPWITKTTTTKITQFKVINTQHSQHLSHTKHCSRTKFICNLNEFSHPAAVAVLVKCPTKLCVPFSLMDLFSIHSSFLCIKLCCIGAKYLPFLIWIQYWTEFSSHFWLLFIIWFVSVMCIVSGVWHRLCVAAWFICNSESDQVSLSST